jgi:tRNA1Val (adenine37-N6)-methyltransferase
MSVFRFKQFNVKQEHSAMKVGTDAMLLGSLVQADVPKQVLDIGTGTGVLALMMAQRFQESRIEAIEIDTASAQEARENFDESSWNDRLNLIEVDFLLCNFDHQFDLIISNPPYYQSRSENDDPRKSQARHESALPMKAMLEGISNLLTDEGSFWVIIPSEISDVWIESAAEFHLDCKLSISIFGKEGGEVKRNILEFKTRQSNVAAQQSESAAHRSDPRCDINITIRNAEGSYTNQYIELTREFHFNKLD